MDEFDDLPTNKEKEIKFTKPIQRKGSGTGGPRSPEAGGDKVGVGVGVGKRSVSSARKTETLRKKSGGQKDHAKEREKEKREGDDDGKRATKKKKPTKRPQLIMNLNPGGSGTKGECTFYSNSQPNANMPDRPQCKGK